MKLDIADIRKRAGLTEETHIIDHPKGQFGTIIVLDDDKTTQASKFAKLLGVPNGWKLTKVGAGFAAFNSGDRLTLYSDKRDYESNEIEDSNKAHSRAGKHD